MTWKLSRARQASTIATPAALALRAGVLAAVLAACSSGAPSPASTAQTTVTPLSPTVTASLSATTLPSPTARTVALLPKLPTSPLPAATSAALQAVLASLVARGAPDAIGAVMTAQGTWSGAAGIDGPAGRRATVADEFAIVSIGKIVLAAAVLRLAETGKVDLDAPLARYLGNLPLDANGATVRQALAMRSGIGDTPSALVDEARAHCGRVWTRLDVVPSVPRPYTSPGTTSAYSNPTYKLLAYAVEQVTGNPLDVALRDLVFSPAGMSRILQQVPNRTTPSPWALPISGHEGGIDLAAYGVGGTLPCVGVSSFSFQGAIASDAPTLAAWGWALFSGALLNQDSLLAMTAVTHGDHSSDPDWYGLGIERLSDFDSPAYGTRGSQSGYNSFLVILPERQIVAVLFINDSDADVQAGVHRLVDAVP